MSRVSIFVVVAFIGVTVLPACVALSENSNWQAIPTSITNNVPKPDTNDEMTGDYLANLPADFIFPTDAAGQKLLAEYGALFIARGGVQVPRRVVFENEVQVATFQTSAGEAREVMGGITITLQPGAMKALKAAIAEAGRVSITPRGKDAAKRSYAMTVSLWASRVEPGLNHWVAKGRISQEDAKRIRALSPYEQVPEILTLETKGIYFAKSLSKSIIYSVAPPGSSQHLSMLALDVSEYDNANVRAVLAKHGWFQTVLSDLPHFTYLGVPAADLPGLGLKKVQSDGRTFWVPNLSPAN